MSTEIIKVLDALAEKFGMAIDWTSMNVIPYLEQLCSRLVNYTIATSVVWMVIGAIILITSIILIVSIVKGCCLDDEDVILLLGLLVCAGIVGIVVIVCQTFDIVTCFTFPEKIIIDYLKDFSTNT